MLRRPHRVPVLASLTLGLLLFSGFSQPQQIKDAPLARLDNTVFLPVAIDGSGALSTPMASIANSDFESGADSNWTESSTVLGNKAGVIVKELHDTSIVAPRSGRFVAWLGGINGDISILSQPITLPAGALKLEYAYRAYSEETACDVDRGEIALMRGDVVHVLAIIELCISKESEQWTVKQLDLTPYSGQDWILRFRVETSERLYSHLFIDDVRVLDSGQ